MLSLLFALALPAAAEPLDWARLVRHEHRVTYLGETHRDEAFKGALIAGLPALKAAGITHLAVEMLGDDVATRPFSPDALRRALEDHWGHSVDSNLGLLAEADRLGLEIVALDLPAREKSRATFELANDPEMLGPPKHQLPPPWSLPSELSASLVRMRDERMAANIARALEDPAARVLALVGSFHAHGSFQPARLRALGHGSRSYLVEAAPSSADEAFDGRIVLPR